MEELSDRVITAMLLDKTPAQCFPMSRVLMDCKELSIKTKAFAGEVLSITWQQMTKELSSITVLEDWEFLEPCKAMMNISKDAIKKHLTSLEKAGFIEKTRTGGNFSIYKWNVKKLKFFERTPTNLLNGEADE